MLILHCLGPWTAVTGLTPYKYLATRWLVNYRGISLTDLSFDLILRILILIVKIVTWRSLSSQYARYFQFNAI